MKLYSLQFRLTTPQENLKRVLNYLRGIERNSLVLLPEMWFSGFDYENLKVHARETQRILKILKDISLEKNAVICGTLPEESEEGIFNTAFLIEDGEIVGKRSKIKLFPLFDEDKYFARGKENRVFETKFGKVGILICFELRFTELIMDFWKNRPDIILVPAQWGYARRKHFEILCRARAVELQSYLVASNTWGEYLGTRYAGHSGIYSPWGEVLAFSEKGDTLLSAEYDRNYLQEIRRTLPMEFSS